MTTTQNIIIICGTTSSGKTALALQLAKEFTRANILSVDSRQVYRGLDIVTGKDTPQDLPTNIKFFGLDIFDVEDRANLGEFVRYAREVIKESLDSNTPLIIVGGTGLYLKAITENLSDTQIPPNPRLRHRLEKLTIENLQEILKKENPQKFASLNHSDVMNPRRLIRAIEISKSHFQSNPESIQIIPHSNITFHWIGLTVDKKTLKTKIRNRVVERIKSGAIEEVALLLKKYPNRKLSVFSSLGVKQIRDFLEGKIQKDKLIEVWTNAEVDYARRQTVWFKKQKGIVWYDNSIARDILINK
jgi:tRNA dimethylallyltransferase